MATVYRMSADDGDPRHGTRNGYSNLKCRCAECKAAWAAYYDGLRRQRLANLTTPDDPRHGLANFYKNHGCRCQRCRDAHQRSRKREAV
jgi:hypothetical protein